MESLHLARGATLTMGLFWREDVSASGVVGLDGDGRITGFKEKPAAHEMLSNWVNAGLFLCEARVHQFIPPGQVSDFGHDILPAMLSPGNLCMAIPWAPGKPSIGSIPRWIWPAPRPSCRKILKCSKARIRLLRLVDNGTRPFAPLGDDDIVAGGKKKGGEMILARAPMRITLGGGGTDLPSYYSKYGGFILSAAIDKYLYIYVNRPAADDLIRVKYSRYEEVTDPDQVQHDLVRPALKLLGIKNNVEIVSMADVPAGTGLGSSSTYLVGLLTSLYELKRERIPTQALAEFAFKVEKEMAGHPVGKQDHYLAAFGGITCLDIEPDGRVQVSPLNISMTTAEDLHSRVLLFFSGISRSANNILQEQRRDTQKEDPNVVESLHRTKEMGYRVKEDLQNGDLEKFGHLLHEHWENKKRRSGAISNPENRPLV